MQALFSEHWHLVHHLKPRLRNDIIALPRTLRSKTWILLHDTFTHKFIRITPEAWQVIVLMDGHRTLDEIWEITCAQAESDQEVVGQHDLVQILSQLYSNDMLATQISADASEMLERFHKQRFNRIKSSYFNPLSIKIPLFYPDKWFDRQCKLADMIFSPIAFVLWLACVLPATALLWQHWAILTENFSDHVLAIHNLFILWLTYPVVKSIHEWAHGLAVKAWRGSVREMGLMVILFMPVPYVDASSSYRFASKWQRATVAAAGIMAEQLLGAIAVYVWLCTEAGIVHALAFNIILISGVSTLLINGNPLMRYDGYYILADLLEIPNLAQRAKNYWVYLSDRFLFGSRDAKPPLGYENEWFWLLFYGAVAPIYRIVIMVSLIWFVAQQYFFFGVLMALVSTWLTLLQPLYKAIQHIFSGSSLVRYQSQVLRRFFALVITGVVIIFLIPLPFYSIQEGVVWLPEQAVVRASTEGHLTKQMVKPSQVVQIGESVLILNNPKIIQEKQLVEERINTLTLQIRQTQPQDLAKMRLLHQQKIVEETKLKHLQQEIEYLNIRAKSKGYWYPADIKFLEGQFVRKGDILGYVVAGASDIVRVAVHQDDMKLIEERVQNIEIRPVNHIEQSHTAKIIRITPRGDFELPSPALGIEGGGQIVTQLGENGKQQALKRFFDVDLSVLHHQSSDERLIFGQRVYVRFDLGRAPFAWQLILRLKQLFLKELHV
jgi:Peptidase family M50.